MNASRLLSAVIAAALLALLLQMKARRAPQKTTPGSAPAGLVTPAAQASSACVPRPLAPERGALADNGCGSRQDPMEWAFEWAPCEGARDYHLRVYKVGAQIAAIDQAPIAATSFMRSNSSYIVARNQEGWEWTVRARYQDGWGPWSEPVLFDVEPMDTDCGGPKR